MVYTIFRHGGHLEIRIKTILAIFVPPVHGCHIRNLLTFGPVVSEEKSRKEKPSEVEKSFESVDGRRTDEGGFPSYKLPWSLRLRGAKKVSELLGD